MATITVQASGVTAPDNWTLKAGASKVAAVNQPDDDATSYIESSSSFPTYQTFTLSPALSAGDTITQVVVHARARRGGALDCNFVISYAFTPQGGGSQTGSSGTLTAGANFANFSYTDSGLNVAWGSDFTIYARNTQARNLDFTTFYAVITYTPAPTNQTLTGAHIASTAAVYTPVKLTKKLAGATIASGVTMYAPAKVTKKLAGATIASTAALYAPAKLSRKIAGASIASTVTLYAPSSVSVADAPTVITGVHIASTATLYAPAKLTLKVAGATIASTAALHAGMVHRGALRIESVYAAAFDDISSLSRDIEVPEDESLVIVFVGMYSDEWTTAPDYTVRLDNNTEDDHQGAGDSGGGVGLDAWVFNVSAAGVHPLAIVLEQPAYFEIVVLVISGVKHPAASYQDNTRLVTMENAAGSTITYSPPRSNGMLIFIGAQTTGNLSPYFNSLILSLFIEGLPLAGVENIETGDPSGTDALGVWISEKYPILSGAFILPLFTLYPPARVALEGQDVDGAIITTTVSVNTPAMVTKALAGATIASTAVVRTPAQAGHRLGGAAIAATVLNAPTVSVGTRALALPAFATSTTLHAGAMAPGGVTLAGEYVALSPTVHTPAAVVPGAVRLLARPPDIATQVMAPARVVNFRYMTPPRIESTAVLYAPAGAVSNTVIYAPHIGEGLPKAINAPHIALLAIHVFALRTRLYGTGATVAATTVVHAPTAITVGEDLWLGRVYPPVEVETV